jgi:hypothetical protein
VEPAVLTAFKIFDSVRNLFRTVLLTVPGVQNHWGVSERLVLDWGNEQHVGRLTREVNRLETDHVVSGIAIHQKLGGALQTIPHTIQLVHLQTQS